MSMNAGQFSFQSMPTNVTLQIQQPNQSMSGNIRLESQFTKVPQNPNLSAVMSAMSDLSPKPPTEIFKSQDRISEAPVSNIGGPSSSVAAATENKSAIGRLDDLIDDFSKPNNNF